MAKMSGFNDAVSCNVFVVLGSKNKFNRKNTNTT